MGKNWQKHLVPFYGKECKLSWDYKSGTRIIDKEIEAIYVFDAEAEAENVNILFENVIGDWATVEEVIGKGGEDLVMFATQTYDDDPFSMVEMIFFYDRTTGETYLYEEGSYDALRPGSEKPPYRLDQLRISIK